MRPLKKTIKLQKNIIFRLSKIKLTRNLFFHVTKYLIAKKPTLIYYYVLKDRVQPQSKIMSSFSSSYCSKRNFPTSVEHKRFRDLQFQSPFTVIESFLHKIKVNGD